MYAGQAPVWLAGLLEMLAEPEEAPFQLLHVPVLEIVTVFVMVEVLVMTDVEQTGPAPYVTVEQEEVIGYPAVSMW